MNSCPQYIVAHYGIQRLGAIVGPCGPLSNRTTLEYQLCDLGAEVAIVADNLYPVLATVKDRTAVKRVAMGGSSRATAAASSNQHRPRPACGRSGRNRAGRARCVQRLRFSPESSQRYIAHTSRISSRRPTASAYLRSVASEGECLRDDRLASMRASADCLTPMRSATCLREARCAPRIEQRVKRHELLADRFVGPAKTGFLDLPRQRGAQVERHGCVTLGLAVLMARSPSCESARCGVLALASFATS